MEGKRRRKAKNKRKTVLRLLFLFGILLLILAGVVAGILLLNHSMSTQAALTQLPFAPQDKAIFTGQGFLYVKDGTLYYKDLNNESSDYHAPVASDLKLAASATIHAVYNSKALKIVDTTYPVEFTGTLLYVTCGSTTVAALRADETGAETIQVFDRTGAQKDQLTFPGQFIVDYGFYTAGNEYLYVLTTSLDSGTPLSTITIYDMTRAATSGVMQIQNQLIEHIYFTSSGIYAVGTNQLIRYSLEGNRESYREMLYGWEVMDYEAAGSPLFLLRPRSADKPGTVKLLTVKDADVAGTTQRLYQLPAGTVDAFIMGGKLVAVTNDGYTVYGADGKLVNTRHVAAEIVSAEKIDSGTLLLHSASACYTVKVA
ncbi:MAG TPA: hypothetical protein VN366_00960 [Feifaniaceae bacterium]|nr:hypothetical protein [Feifaniaceae bacterium]